MSDNKTINYSAADIERYHKGLMTALEMNAFEKAALDDPFLADAIEGYAAEPVNAQADISLLNKRLEERISDDKIVPVKKLNFTWLRVAALFIIIAGAGLLTYSYVFNKSKQDVAAIEKTDTTSKKVQPADTSSVPNIDSIKKTIELEQKEKLVATKDNGGYYKKKTAAPVANGRRTEKKDVGGSKAEKDIAAPVTDKLEDVAIKGYAKYEKSLNDTIKFNFTTKPQPNVVSPQFKSGDVAQSSKFKSEQAFDKARVLKEPAVNRAFTTPQNKINYFRGQVLDANNSPLPFANVMIVPDHIGTYTDAKGNFVLISPDSVLDIRVRSLGFENDTTKLFTGATANAIVLKADFNNIPSTVLNNKKINTQRKRGDNMQVEEPEPEDGWSNYDTYLANNIEITDAIKMKTTPSSEVELSFEVNTLGEPVNVKIEKSVCNECDAEAVRLLKEGPKWKKNKSRRAKVSVGFSTEQ